MKIDQRYIKVLSRMVCFCKIEQKGTNLRPPNVQQLIDCVKHNNLQADFFFIDASKCEYFLSNSCFVIFSINFKKLFEVVVLFWETCNQLPQTMVTSIVVVYIYLLGMCCMLQCEFLQKLGARKHTAYFDHALLVNFPH